MRSLLARWGALVLIACASVVVATPAGHALTSTPNDPLFGVQWNMQMIGAPSAWQVATGSGVTIAVVDSGVDLPHDDLANKIIGSADCVGAGSLTGSCKPGGSNGQDDNGHGTHVAGIAAAATDNGTGVAGTAPDASILAIKVLTSSCDARNPECENPDASGGADDVAAGIRYAADHGAAVINLSLGNEVQSVFGAAFQDALDYAWNKGALPVLAAGNSFVLPSGPIDNALVVGALARNGFKASYSNIGTSRWAIMAPGGDFGDDTASCQSSPLSIMSTYVGGNAYACVAGTSMAAPHVAGAAALLRSLGYSNQDTVDRLLATGRDLPTTAADGVKALDVAAAVGQPPTPPPPPPPEETTTTAPPEGGGPGPGDGASTSSSGDVGTPVQGPSGSVVTLPSSNQRAAGPPGQVTARAPNDKGGISSGVVAVAVVMAAGVSTATALYFIRGKNLARRTPPLDR